MLDEPTLIKYIALQDFAKCAIRGSPCTLLSAEAEAEAGSEVLCERVISSMLPDWIWNRRFSFRTSTALCSWILIDIVNLAETLAIRGSH